jgi:hypothetical protein
MEKKLLAEQQQQQQQDQQSSGAAAVGTISEADKANWEQLLAVVQGLSADQRASYAQQFAASSNTVEQLRQAPIDYLPVLSRSIGIPELHVVLIHSAAVRQQQQQQEGATATHGPGAADG